MKLVTAGRTAGKKSEIKRIRREGNIPAVLYSRGEKGKEFVVEGGEFRKFLNSLESGMLSSTIFTVEVNGKTSRAVLKDIQYATTTYNIIHLDFEELHDDMPVTLNIPIKLANALNSAGVKLGGAVRQVFRHLKVSCLPADIPPYFELDIQNLALGHSMKLSELKIPSSVRPTVDLNQVAVIMARK